jgi:hypothetical protein
LEKFIDLLLTIVFSFFKDETIKNRKIVYENEHIYFWMIQTIYYFYDSELEEKIKDKALLENIRNQCMNFFLEYFSHRRPEFLDRVNYIIQYSSKLKEIFNNDNKKIEEISRITRILLEQLLQKAPKKLNEIINICFEFMILSKNNDVQKNIKDDLKTLMNDIMKLTMKPSNNNLTFFNYGLIPKFIYDSLNFNNIDQQDKKPTLKELWKDYNLYENIMNYYMVNL